MYAEFYGLNFEPFQLSPAPQCFFASSVHGRALSYLKFGLSQREGFIVITGEVGAGKTTLIQHLLSTLDARKYILAHVVSTQLNSDELVRMVAGKLGVRSIDRGKASLLQDIEAILIAARRHDSRCLLVVDEAQNLSLESLEELRMLSNLDSRGMPLVQSFLVGQPELRDSLARDELRQLRERVIATYHLSAIGADEVEGYINFRLGLAGWNDDPLFTRDAFVRIHELTGGIPRRINVLCTRVLFYGCLEQIFQFGAEEIDTVYREFEDEREQVFDEGRVRAEQSRRPAAVNHRAAAATRVPDRPVLTETPDERSKRVRAALAALPELPPQGVDPAAVSAIGREGGEGAASAAAQDLAASAYAQDDPSHGAVEGKPHDVELATPVVQTGAIGEQLGAVAGARPWELEKGPWTAWQSPAARGADLFEDVRLPVESENQGGSSDQAGAGAEREGSRLEPVLVPKVRPVRPRASENVLVDRSQEPSFDSHEPRDDAIVSDDIEGDVEDDVSEDRVGANGSGDCAWQVVEDATDFSREVPGRRAPFAGRLLNRVMRGLERK